MRTSGKLHARTSPMLAVKAGMKPACGCRYTAFGGAPLQALCTTCSSKWNVNSVPPCEPLSDRACKHSHSVDAGQNAAPFTKTRKKGYLPAIPLCSNTLHSQKITQKVKYNLVIMHAKCFWAQKSKHSFTSYIYINTYNALERPGTLQPQVSQS